MISQCLLFSFALSCFALFGFLPIFLHTGVLLGHSCVRISHERNMFAALTCYIYKVDQTQMLNFHLSHSQARWYYLLIPRTTTVSTEADEPVNLYIHHGFHRINFRASSVSQPTFEYTRIYTGTQRLFSFSSFIFYLFYSFASRPFLSQAPLSRLVT